VEAPSKPSSLHFTDSSVRHIVCDKRDILFTAECMDQTDTLRVAGSAHNKIYNNNNLLSKCSDVVPCMIASKQISDIEKIVYFHLVINLFYFIYQTFLNNFRTCID
jgi:hypothetical protein